ncbi:hypothetical protein F444_05306 [Phytophthora nicotianae P1976]|uniref:Uncharacterized protein n=1 Tax=Phytophthora nicotianae P1976 TaxID=1317066 RepID=A0A081AMN1_PHYNI|nr:hypothetical protein F444_05306 [Phytophthora nicotianae P1976]
MSLSERILSHVNASQLHRSTNVVLQEEFSALNEAVGDIVAIFANAEEVRDAVHQLEQGKVSTSCSYTVLEVMIVRWNCNRSYTTN